MNIVSETNGNSNQPGAPAEQEPAPHGPGFSNPTDVTYAYPWTFEDDPDTLPAASPAPLWPVAPEDEQGVRHA